MKLIQSAARVVYWLTMGIILLCCFVAPIVSIVYLIFGNQWTAFFLAYWSGFYWLFVLINGFTADWSGDAQLTGWAFLGAFWVYGMIIF